LPAHGNYSLPWGVRDFSLDPRTHGNLFLRSSAIQQVNFVTPITLF
jgi:hypothetical protein